MKSFFSRRHDSQTGHSKSASRESYKFWIPNTDAERNLAKPAIIPAETVATQPTTRPHLETRTSSRTPKPSHSNTQSKPIYDKSAAPNSSTTGLAPEKIGQLSSRLNPGSSSTQYAQVYSETIPKASSRHRDYNYIKPQAHSRSTAGPSHPTGTWSSRENPIKPTRHANSTTTAQHELWLPPSNVQPTPKVEDWTEHNRPRESPDVLDKHQLRNEEKEATRESGKRERERERTKERERDRGREREGEKEWHKHQRDREREEKGRDSEREGGRDRDGERIHEKERERLKQVERDKERDRGLEPEKQRAEREKERERREQREKGRLRYPERDRPERDRDRDKDRDHERERSRREWERERDKGKERENEASPTTRGKDRHREGDAASQKDVDNWEDGTRIRQQDKTIAGGARNDGRNYDRDVRQEHEGRSGKEHHRLRERERDQAKYRAEATDGEDLFRPKATMVRDKRNEASQGWVSDNYTIHERKPSRQVRNEPPTGDEGDSSDNSLKQTHRPRTLQTRNRIPDGPVSTSKLGRSRQDRPTEPLTKITSSNPSNHPQIPAVTIPLDNQPPTGLTPQRMPVYLPPREARTIDRAFQQSSTMLKGVAASDTEAATRREINRLKLNARPEDPTAQSVEISSSPMELVQGPRRPPSRASGPSHNIASQVSASHTVRVGNSVPQMRQVQASSVMPSTPNTEIPRDVRHFQTRPEGQKEPYHPPEYTLPTRLQPSTTQELGHAPMRSEGKKESNALPDFPLNLSSAKLQSGTTREGGHSRIRSEGQKKSNALINHLAESKYQTSSIRESGHLRMRSEGQQDSTGTDYRTESFTAKPHQFGLADASLPNAHDRVMHESVPFIPSQNVDATRKVSHSTVSGGTNSFVPLPASLSQKTTLPSTLDAQNSNSIPLPSTESQNAPFSTHFPLLKGKETRLEAQMSFQRTRTDPRVLNGRPNPLSTSLIEGRYTATTKSKDGFPDSSNLARIDDGQHTLRLPQPIPSYQPSPKKSSEILESQMHTGSSIQRPSTVTDFKDSPTRISTNRNYHVPLPQLASATDASKPNLTTTDLNAKNGPTNPHLSEDVGVGQDSSSQMAQIHNNIPLLTPSSNSLGYPHPFPAPDSQTRIRELNVQGSMGMSISRPSTSTALRQGNTGKPLRNYGYPPSSTVHMISHTESFQGSIATPVTGADMLNPSGQQMQGSHENTPRSHSNTTPQTSKALQESLLVTGGKINAGTSQTYTSTPILPPRASPATQESPKTIIQRMEYQTAVSSIVPPITSSYPSNIQSDSPGARDRVRNIRSTETGSLPLPALLGMQQDSPNSVQRIPATPVVPSITLPMNVADSGHRSMKTAKGDSPQLRVENQTNPLGSSSLPEFASSQDIVDSGSKNDSPSWTTRNQGNPSGKPDIASHVAGEIHKAPSGGPTTVPQIKIHHPITTLDPKHNFEKPYKTPAPLPAFSLHAPPQSFSSLTTSSRMPMPFSVETAPIHAENMQSQVSILTSHSEAFIRQSSNQTHVEGEKQVPSMPSRQEISRNPTASMQTVSSHIPIIVEKQVDAETPSLGFFTNTFSAALNAPMDQLSRQDSPPIKPLNMVETDVIDSFSRVPANDLGGLRDSQQKAPVKQVELRMDTTDKHHGAPRLEHGCSQKTNDAELLRSSKPSIQPLPAMKQSESNYSLHTPMLTSHPKIHHPVLAELLSSPPPSKSLAPIQTESLVASANSVHQRMNTGDANPSLELVPKPRVALPEKIPGQGNRTPPSKSSNFQGVFSSSQGKGTYAGPSIGDTVAQATRAPSSSNHPTALVQPTLVQMGGFSATDGARNEIVRPFQDLNQSQNDASMAKATPSSISQTLAGYRGMLSEGNPSHKTIVQSADVGSVNAYSQAIPPSHSYATPSQYTNRHQHSTAFPASLGSSLAANHASGLPRSAALAPAQTRFASIPINPNYVRAAAEKQKLALPRSPSEETVLMTPSSLAQSMMLKPTTSRQSVTPSVSSQTARKGGLFNMFRKATPQPAQQYEIWHPNASSKTPDSSPGHSKGLDTPPDAKIASSIPPRMKTPVAVTITAAIPIATEPKAPKSSVFTPFRYLTSKKNRSVSVASVEAQDGTAPNTVVGSPTASMHSQAPIQPPPTRDPWLATEEWRNNEEADAKARLKGRRQRPGVVFDVAEETPQDTQRPRRIRTRYRSSGRQPETPRP